MPDEFNAIRNLAQVLQLRAEKNPDVKVYRWLMDGKQETQSLTFADLDLRARSIADTLQVVDAARSRALLLYPPGLEFIEALFGCYYAGIVAVPAYAPRSGRDRPRIEAILENSDCGAILTTESALEDVTALLGTNSYEPLILASDRIPSDRNAAGDVWKKKETNIAYLQYSSGSTSAPKAAVITHDNVLHNIRYLSEIIQIDGATTMVSWLPHFHDMGLMSGILPPVYWGCHSILLSPGAFIHRPLRWLNAISRYRGTHSGAPNFAYDLCVERFSEEECCALDLSSWKVAFNGSEPVRIGTLQRFSERFAGSGFHSRSFCPVYGLAEATVMVSGAEVGAKANVCSVDPEAMRQSKVRVVDASEGAAVRFVSCGRAKPSHEIVVVDPATLHSCGEDEIGEIWFAGPSVAEGYWKNPEATQAAFNAALEAGTGRFLRTGDCGFLHGGELFIAGRLKDCIIIHGFNHYPQDIELTAERAHVAVNSGGSAAFSIEHAEEERLIIVSEINRRSRSDLAEVIEAIRQAVANEHEIQAFAVVLIQAGALPKTSSGKVQRQQCKTQFLQGTLKVLMQSVLTPEEDQAPTLECTSARLLALNANSRKPYLENYVRQLIGHISHQPMEAIHFGRSLAGLGMDSLMIAALQQRLNGNFDAQLSLAGLLDADVSSIADILLKQAEQSSGRQAMVRVEAGERSAVLPLSFSQEQVWLWQELSPEACAYNEVAAIELSGELKVEALQEAINAMVRRHEILRTTFSGNGRNAYQAVQPFKPLEIPVLEIGDGQVHEVRVNINCIAAKEARRHFQLDADVPVRFIILRQNSRNWSLLVLAHHLVCDAESFRIMLREIAQLYGDYVASTGCLLPELTIQYADYAIWQRQHSQEQVFAEQMEYWKKQLANVQALRLVTDRPRPATIKHDGASVPLRVEQDLVGKLEELSRKHGVTLFMTLLAALKIVLSKYARQQDIAVGASIANRNFREIEGLIGLFINVLVLRTDLGGNPSLKEVLGRVKQTALEAYRNQDVPFSNLVHELQPEREGSRTPFFQTLFAFLPMMSQEMDAAGVRFSYQEAIESGIARFDLTLRVVAVHPVLHARIEYNTQLWEQSSIQRMGRQMKVVLEEMVKREEGVIGEIEWMREEEREQVLGEWSGRRRGRREGWGRRRSVVEWFEEGVKGREGKRAVVSGRKELSYVELNRRGNQLGRYLRRGGVREESRVGLYVERSVEMVVGLMGIMKAGGAYVPLEWGYPEERLKRMVEEGEVKWVVVRGGEREERKKGLWEEWEKRGVRVVKLEEEVEAMVGESEEDLERREEEENLVYVMYTSGSTGKAKGVGIEQRQLVNYVEGVVRRMGVKEGGKYATVSTVAADLGNTMIFPALVKGGELHVVEEEMLLDGERLGRYVEEEGIDYLKIVPSHLVGLQGVKGGEKVMPRELLVVGGEVSRGEWVERWRGLREGCRVMNHYGPTETTVGALTYEVGEGGREEEGGGRGVPIGRPMEHVRVYVVDEEMEPVPVGVCGELMIGGGGVGRGYVNGAGMTAERFVPDPFGGEEGEGEGERLYRTGDLVRWREDGNVEYVGRMDQQVKMRGYRIELGEIEGVLQEAGGVEQAVVEMEEGEAGEKRLVAYVVVRRSGSGAEQGEQGERRERRERRERWKSYLKERLPEYMVPGVYVELGELPVTENGKVDRKRLLRGGRRREEEEGREGRGGREEERMSNEVEEILGRIWGEVLGRERVRREENFFEMGGDSILSIQVVGRGREEGLEITPKQMFEHPTVAELAKVVGMREHGVKEKWEQGPVKGKVELTPIQRAFFSWGLARPEHYNQSVMVEVSEEVRSEDLEKGVKGLLRQHDGMRMRYERGEGGEWEQWCEEEEGGGVYERKDLSGGGEREWREEMEEDGERVQRSMELERGGLVRAVEYELGKGGGRRLLLVAHHLVVDVVSWRILLEDLERACRQLQAGGAIDLGRKTTSYQEWGKRLKEYQRSEDVMGEMEYWKRQGEESWEAGEMPRDGEEGKGARGDGEQNLMKEQERVIEWLEEEETVELLQQVPEVYHTEINDVLLTGLWRVCAEWSGSQRVMVDVEGHGREEVVAGVDVSRTVGWFTTIYPVVLEGGGRGGRGEGWEPGEELKKIKEQLRRVPQRGLGYGLLKYGDQREQRNALGSRREAELRFNYLGQIDQILKQSPLFTFSKEGFGQGSAEENRRRYLLDVEVMVLGGRLLMRWSYSRKLHLGETVERLAARYVESLREILAHCRGGEAGGYTPSDFPLAHLRDEDFKQIAAILEESV